MTDRPLKNINNFKMKTTLKRLFFRMEARMEFFLNSSTQSERNRTKIKTV